MVDFDLLPLMTSTLCELIFPLQDEELDISPVEIDDALVIEDDDISDDEDDDDQDDVCCVFLTRIHGYPAHLDLVFMLILFSYYRFLETILFLACPFRTKYTMSSWVTQPRTALQRKRQASLIPLLGQAAELPWPGARTPLITGAVARGAPCHLLLPPWLGSGLPMLEVSEVGPEIVTDVLFSAVLMIRRS